MKKIACISALMIFLFTSCSTDPNSEIPEAEGSEADVTAKVSIPQNRTDGTDKGYFWTVYKDNGSADMTFPQSNKYPGNFNLSYKNVRNIVGGKGYEGGAQRSINYNIGYLSGNYEFVGVYGWTKNPDIEYYVAEKGDAGTDYSGNGYEYVMRYKSRGSWYKFYKKYIRNQPCALRSGDCNFWQYKSIRENNPKNGNNHSVHIPDHAHIWRVYGGKWGSYTQYQVFGIEAYSGNSRASGTIDATIW